MHNLNKVKCFIYRGGTSRGVFFHSCDIPDEVGVRERMFLGIMGTPDIRQIDGLGGATTHTSKVVIIHPSSETSIDIEYEFIQVGIDHPILDTKGMCGNLLSAAGVFAVDEGLVTADYNKVRETLDQLIHLIDKAETVAVTTPEGTDLKMKIAGRKALRLAGFAQEPGSLSGLPSGEAATAPLEGTTEGKIVNPFSMDAIGIIKDPFALTIKNGRVTKVEGGLEAIKLKNIFANCDEFGTNTAEFAIGANPAARITGHIIEDKRRLGTVHIAVGDNMTLGGGVRSNIHYEILLFNPTVRMDDKLVVDNGSLIV